MARKSTKAFTPTRFMLPTSYYDEVKADYAIAFIENLRHTKGQWYKLPFKLLNWQEEIIRNIFGDPAGNIKPDKEKSTERIVKWTL